VCKVLESMIRDEMMAHLKKFNLIKESQHGFVQKRSCLTNLLEFLEHVTNYVDQGYPIDVIYLDFQKAFDKVPHKRLMFRYCR
jgi:Reverse transcriptase (RNA-dependent DNA polymerase)